MTDHSTIWMAIDLMRAPANVKRVRAAPLPKDVGKLLALASGDPAAITEAKNATGRSEESLREAAGFYIEQIMLHADADHYRVLGTQFGAGTAELRRNMAVLMRWLHPDHKNAADRTIFAARVTRAWNELKSEDRRAAYDLGRRREFSKRSDQAKQKSKPSTVATRSTKPHRPSAGLFKRMLISLFGERVL